MKNGGESDCRYKQIRAALVCLVTGSLWVTSAWGQGAANGARQDTTAARQDAVDISAETATKILEPFTVAAVGDLIEPQPLYSDDPRFQQLIRRIKEADVGFANMESSLVDFKSFQGPVAGTETPLETGAAIKAMGVTMVNHANNHTFDGGLAGMISTDQALDRLGIVHAGTGMNLQQARAAAYQETPKGRVGLVGMYSVDDWSPYGPAEERALATYRNGDLGGAPGENPLHLITYRVVTASQLQELKSLAASIYGAQNNDDVPAKDGAPERFRYFNQWYEVGTDAGALHYEMNPKDEHDILQSIRVGKVNADFMIVTIHSHQTSSFRTSQSRGGIDHDVPDFLAKLAHASIDNGADMFVVHGMHGLRGVEIYKGKPIFYDIANFVFQFGLQLTDTPLSAEELVQSKRRSTFTDTPSQIAFVATSHFEHGKLTEVRLYPADLGGKQRPLSQMGIPMTPEPQLAQQVLHDLQEYSAPLGTRIAIEGNVGVIKVSN
jgi:poly-gamma-glutamate synthesis protein (capsule biosynthesis protein)